MQIQTTIEINAAPDDVWRVLKDVERWHEWTASIDEVHLLDGAAFDVGAKARIKQPKMPPIVWTVTEVTPNHGFAWTSASAGVEVVATHTIEPTANGSRVTLTVNQKGFILNLMPWLKSMGQRYIEMEAQGLKHRTEQLALVA